MSQPEREPNPERRTTAALFCLCAGMAVLWLSGFLGMGAGLSAALQQSSAPAAAAALLGAGAAALGAGILGMLMSTIGGVWLVVQVIVDQAARDPYSRGVER